MHHSVWVDFLRFIAFWASPTFWWMWGVPLLFLVGLLTCVTGAVWLVRSKRASRWRGVALMSAGLVLLLPSSALLFMAWASYNVSSSMSADISPLEGTYRLAPQFRELLAERGSGIDAVLTIGSDGAMEARGASWVGPPLLHCELDGLAMIVRCGGDAERMEMVVISRAPGLALPARMISIDAAAREVLGAAQQVPFERIEQ